MKKNYVLDTNVLLYDPNSIFMFQDNNIYIPLVVVEELDTFKKNMNELGVNSRTVIKTLDSLRNLGRLNEGVTLKSGGKLYVTPFRKVSELNVNLDEGYADNKLLYISNSLKSIDVNEEVILVTKDINLRVKADALGIQCEDYKKASEGSSEYSGVSEVAVSKDTINDIYEERSVKYKLDCIENQYLIIRNESDKKHSALARYTGGNVELLKGDLKAVNIRPKNTKQKFAMDALLDPSIKLVTLSGNSGTGKTLITIAAGIHGVEVEHNYEKITVTRPVVPVGEGIGFLPGSIDDKMDPWMQPIYDALEVAMKSDSGPNIKSTLKISTNPEDLIQIAPLNYIRGRSITNSYMVIDESQNLSPLEIKTIITRAGRGTKIVLTGDLNQIDHPYLNSQSNGLSYVINRFAGKRLYAHVTLTDGERSELAEMASKIL